MGRGDRRCSIKKKRRVRSRKFKARLKRRKTDA